MKSLQRYFPVLVFLFLAASSGSHSGETIPLNQTKKLVVKGSRTIEFSCLLTAPAGYTPDKAWPLILGLHGTFGTAQAQYETYRGSAYRNEYLFALPTAPKDIGLGRSDIARKIVLATLAEARKTFRVDPDRIFVDGISMGGHAALDIGLYYPHLFAGVIKRCGPPLSPTFFKLYANFHTLPILILHGGNDSRVKLKFIQSEIDQLKGFQAPVQPVILKDRGHEGFLDQNDRVLSWMKTLKRNPYPERIEFTVYDLRYNRSHWVRIEELYPSKQKIRHGVRNQMGQVIEEFEYPFEPGRITARRQGNTIELTTKKIKRVTLFFNDKLVDFSKPIIVKWNKRIKSRRKLQPSEETLKKWRLEHPGETPEYSAFLTVSYR